MNHRRALNAFHWAPWLALAALCFSCGNAAAQLDDEMRDLLTEILPELDPDLRSRFQAAIDANQSRVILTPDQFRRFREHPLNPFDGMSGIDPNELRGNIELKFEVPSLRDRVVGDLERNHPSWLSQSLPNLTLPSSSIVKISDGTKIRCLGTVVALPPRILTKASEIENCRTLAIVVERPGGVVTLPARVSNLDADNDLAILELAPGISSPVELEPVIWSLRQPTPGEFVITPDRSGSGSLLGTYSNPPRAQKSHGQGFLGVQPENGTDGVRLVEVTSGGAASVAGLKPGDVIVRLDEAPITDVTQLVAEIGRRNAGDEITLQFKRDNQHQVLKVVLAGRDLSAERASKFRMMNRLGAIPSKRSEGFDWVFQHDTPLFPEQCGGPILDLEGNVIGINIAREGRVSSLAIPAAHLQTILPILLRENVAAR